jgi:tripartite-type tricarboxylate transporter receptor subunit TctC
LVEKLPAIGNLLGRIVKLTHHRRSVALPELPTVGEFVQGYEASLWWGVGAPKNTPTEIVIKLNREINLGLADSGIRERLAQLGVEVLSGSPADFAQLIAADAERWGRVIRAANIKVE